MKKLFLSLLLITAFACEKMPLWEVEPITYDFLEGMDTDIDLTAKKTKADFGTVFTHFVDFTRPTHNGYVSLWTFAEAEQGDITNVDYIVYHWDKRGGDGKIEFLTAPHATNLIASIDRTYVVKVFYTVGKDTYTGQIGTWRKKVFWKKNQWYNLNFKVIG